MILFTMKERKFLTKLFLKRAHHKNDTQIITDIVNKLNQPNLLSLTEKEWSYFQKTLFHRLEDVCDCRNEHEINFIFCLIHKIRKIHPNRWIETSTKTLNYKEASSLQPSD